MSINSDTVDYIVIGAGITGLTLADSLQEKGCSVLVFDHKGVAGGASGIPIGLIDPAASRNARLYWDMEKCYNATVENIQKIQSYSDSLLFKKTGILRPGINESRAKAYEKSYHNQQWPVNWCEWKTENEIKKMCPGIRCEYGGLWHPNGITIYISKYLEAYETYLKEQGIQFAMASEYRLQPKINDWVITSSNRHFVARDLIFATGAETRFSQFWKELLLIPVKGQVALFKTKEALPFPFAVSGNGYVGHLDPHTFIVGSTYEHEFDHVEPDQMGKQKLEKQLNQILPSLYQKAEFVQQWAGVRASTPNRLPILGTHRFYKNVHVITGMASKGMVYSKYTSDMMRDYLLDNKEIDKDVSIERIYQKLKRMNIIN